MASLWTKKPATRSMVPSRTASPASFSAWVSSSPSTESWREKRMVRPPAVATSSMTSTSASTRPSPPAPSRVSTESRVMKRA